MSETTNEDRMYPIEMTLQGARCRRKFFKDQPELLRRYERNEARYILQLPKNYDTISINFGIDKNEMKLLVIALAELDLTIDEWLCFR